MRAAGTKCLPEKGGRHLAIPRCFLDIHSPARSQSPFRIGTEVYTDPALIRLYDVDLARLDDVPNETRSGRNGSKLIRHKKRIEGSQLAGLDQDRGPLFCRAVKDT